MKRSPIMVMLGILFLSILGAAAPGAKAEHAVARAVTWGGNSYDYGRSVVVDSSNNIYVVGDTQSFGEGGSDVLILKSGPTGDLTWQKTWGGSNDDGGLAAAVDSSGNIYATGYTGSFGAGDEDVFVLKFNSTGDIVWQKTWGGGGGDRGLGITVDSSGNVYVTGWTLSYGTSTSGWTTYSALFLLKLSSSGNLEWQRTWEEQHVAQCGDCLATDSSGNVYVAGYYGGFILKFNSTGSLMWQRIWGSTDWGSNQCFGLVRDASGNLYIAGQTTDFGAGSCDAFIMKLSPAAGLVWQKTWGGSGDDEARCLTINNASGQIHVAGFTNSLSAMGNYTVFLLTLSSDGDLEHQTIIGGAGADEGLGIALESSGEPVVTGYVSEAPPYDASSSSVILGTPSFSLTTSSISTTSPSAVLGVSSGTVSSSSGSTEYSGNTDALLLIFDAPAIPEFSLVLALPPFILTTLAAAIYRKRRKGET